MSACECDVLKAPESGSFGRWQGWLGPILRRPLLANTVTILTGSVAAQVVNFATAPLLTRLYGPEDFSALAVFTAIVALVLAVATGRYEFALVLAGDERTRSRLAVLCLLLAAGTAVLMTGGVLVLAGPLAWLVPSWISLQWLWLSPLFLLICAGTSVASQWQVARGRFRTVAQGELLVVLVSVAVQILAVTVSARADGTALIAGLLCGRVAALGFLARGVASSLHEHRRAVTVAGLLEVGRCYWRFPAFTTLSELTSAGAVETPRLLLGACFPPQILGLYALCSRVLEKPVQLVGTSLGPAFFRQVSTMQHDPQAVRRLVARVVGYLFVLVLPAVLVVAVWGEPLFGFVFGEQWREAGYFASLLAPMLAVRFAVLPTWTSLLATGRQHVILIWTASYFALTVACFGFSSVCASAAVPILLYSIVSTIMYAVLLGVSLGHGTTGAAGHNARAATVERDAAPIPQVAAGMAE